MTTITQEQRLNRQAQIIHPAMARATVIVAGAGMLGSWTAHALARAVGKLIIYDGGDHVEAPNLGNQAYNRLDIGESKNVALKSALWGLPVHTHDESFPASDVEPINVDVVVSCVDTLGGREAIAKWCLQNSIPLFIDTRAQGEVAVICTAKPNQIAEYLRCMPKAHEVEERRCGAVGSAYAGMWVASQVAATINAYYRALPLQKLLVWHVGLNQEIKRTMYNDIEGGDKQ